LQGFADLGSLGNAGIGAATVKELAAHNPSCIYLCARTPSNAKLVVDEARASHPKVKIEVQQLNLASFDSIKNCAAEVNNKSERLDLLLLNAGLAGVAAKLTTEGYEIHMGVNHLGHALLTQLLMPKLLKTAASRTDVRVVVTTSLMAHKSSPTNGVDLNQSRNADAFGSATQRYGHSKLANILFARKLAQRYPDILTMSQHPGIVQTDGYYKADGVNIPHFIIRPFLWLSGVAPEKGAYNVGSDTIQDIHSMANYFRRSGVLPRKLEISKLGSTMSPLGSTCRGMRMLLTKPWPTRFGTGRRKNWQNTVRLAGHPHKHVRRYFGNDIHW
jgi:NAD(P)-dependent dehydrogenase (short-subunit alcohol dehydrogenase family)